MWIEYKIREDYQAILNTDNLVTITYQDEDEFSLRLNMLDYNANLFFESREELLTVYEGFKDALNGESIELDVGWIRPLDKHKRKKEFQEQIDMERKRKELEMLRRNIAGFEPICPCGIGYPRC